MFPYADAQSRLDLHHQRVAELIQVAAAHRQALEAASDRPRRFGRWPRRAPAARTAEATVSA
jgi:hypothetical protein